MAMYGYTDEAQGDAGVGQWTTTPEGIPVFRPHLDPTRAEQAAATAPLSAEIMWLVKLLDKAIEIGDRLSIATIETRLGFGYGDRFMRSA
jgi:hypothetical protein